MTPDLPDVIALHDGRVLEVHPPSACASQRCCVHQPSDHPLSAAPLHWRSDRRLMERICPHGIGHPDPDGLAWERAAFGDEFAWARGIHGCDGCCSRRTP